MARYGISLLSTLLFTSLPLVEAAAPCPGGVYGVAASALASYKPAQTFCSSKYPVPAVTRTVTGPTATKTSTVASVTVTTTVATNTITVTAPPVVLTATSVATELTSSTLTVTVALPPQQKRELDARAMAAATTADAKAAAFSSLVAQATSFVRTVCTCLQTAQTVTATATPVATVSVTATSTVSATQTTTVSITPTITTTVSSTTTITTVVATATVGPSFNGPVCNSDDPLTFGAGGCSANCYCDTRRQQPAGVTFGYGVCDTETRCGGTSCQSDIDCPTGQACAAGAYFNNCPSGPRCVDFTACTSSLSKREVLVRGSQMEKAARLARLNMAKGEEMKRKA